MTTSLMLERAKQGDAGAIAALMNDVLQVQEVWVKATLESDCLQVMLKSPAVLNQLTCIAFIQRGLLRLQPADIQQVRAYAWRTGDAFPLWIATFSLEQNAPLQAQATPGVAQSLQQSLSPKVPFGGSAPTSLQPPAQALAAPLPAAKPRSELFKLGFVIVLMTMAYFVMIGV
jgi:hypothetical protein